MAVSESQPYRNLGYAQRDLDFNRTEKSYLSFRDEAIRRRTNSGSIARRETPFVLAERTGGAFSGAVAVLRYRYSPRLDRVIQSTN